VSKLVVERLVRGFGRRDVLRLRQVEHADARKVDRVLVQRLKQDTKTSSGIFLPSSATSSPLPEAKVIATGPGAPDNNGTVVPVNVKAGDRVLLPGWGGNTIKVGDDEFHLFKAHEILAKIVE